MAGRRLIEGLDKRGGAGLRLLLLLLLLHLLHLLQQVPGMRQGRRRMGLALREAQGCAWVHQARTRCPPLRTWPGRSLLAVCAACAAVPCVRVAPGRSGVQEAVFAGGCGAQQPPSRCVNEGLVEP